MNGHELTSFLKRLRKAFSRPAPRKESSWLWIGLSFAAVLMHYVYFNTLPEMEQNALKSLFAKRGKLVAPAEVVILGIDDETFNRLNRVPSTVLDRYAHVQLLKQLKELGAKGVVFDLLFKKAWEDPSVDKLLAATMKEIPTVVGKFVRPLRDGELLKIPGSYLDPIAPIKDAAKAVGNIYLPIVYNSSVISLSSGAENKVFEPTLAYAAAALYGPVSERPKDYEFINYYGPSRTIEHFSYSKIFDDPVALADKIRGRIVFVGPYNEIGSPIDAKDAWFTSFPGAPTFGVEIQATATANMIRGDWIKRLHPQTELVVLSLLVFVASYIFLLSPCHIVIFLCPAVILAWGHASQFAFVNNFFLPGEAGRFIVLPLMGLFSIVMDSARLVNAANIFYKSLSRYTDENEAKAIGLTGCAPTLGAKTETVATLFTDLAGYTKLSEKTGVGAMIPLLNKYYGVLTGTAMQAKALVLKSAGDAMFSVFSKERGVENPASQALRTSLAIQKRLHALIQSHDFPPTTTRMAVHIGEAEVGRVGSEERFDLTADGDAINVGARLEGLNKYFKTIIIASEMALKQSGEKYNTLYLGKVGLKGRKAPVDIFAIFDEPFPLNEKGVWEEAVKLYQHKEWVKSRELFSKLRWSDSELKFPAKVFMAKCSYRMRKGVPVNFNGSIRFPHK